ncbi:MAG: excinuclease ABC subunit UvrB [Bacteroidota bacterium]|nr:excinuclease ABC subunit UvrB [Bacteroidota bacterium]
MKFKLNAPFYPTGDQPEAIKNLSNGVKNGDKNQCLLGVTGSGKTFTIANVIENTQKPTLILCHNKTLAAQLYSEFKDFFPENNVEYFVSYYDYYQPEAYLPVTGKYIEKDLSVNKEIEKMRLKATSTLLSGKKDIIVVSSVSCIYGLGNPKLFKEKTILIEKNQNIERKKLMSYLISGMYNRVKHDLEPGTFKIIGDSLEIFPSYIEKKFKINFWGEEIDEIEEIDISNNKTNSINKLQIYPNSIFVSNSSDEIIENIYKDLNSQKKYFIENNQIDEAERIEKRTELDIEMIKELGYCPGIENYSRYFDKRLVGERPFCLFDYFPEDFLFVIDESHVTIPQVKGMFGGDKARKKNLVDYGFRLPSALDNRPLNFEEFEEITPQTIYLSATPSDYEMEKCGGVVIEQLIRPNGILEPKIEIRKSKNQIDDLLNEIHQIIKNNERVLVTTLTKKMAERLSEYLIDVGIKCSYIHSEVDTIERIEIMENLRIGNFDVLVGVNLLREGLDFPEVSLVAIIDADKEGFLRSKKSLIQIIGRAARNVNGKAILYADEMTDSIKKTIIETDRKRNAQKSYNTKNNITPKSIKSKRKSEFKKKDIEENTNSKRFSKDKLMDLKEIELKKLMKSNKNLMEKAAKALNFTDATIYRDNLKLIKEILNKKNTY